MATFQPAYCNSGSWATETSPESSGYKARSTVDRTSYQRGASHTHHTHSDWGNVDTPVNLMCKSLGCGRTPKNPCRHEKLQITPTVALARNEFFPH